MTVTNTSAQPISAEEAQLIRQYHQDRQARRRQEHTPPTPSSLLSISIMPPLGLPLVTKVSAG